MPVGIELTDFLTRRFVMARKKNIKTEPKSSKPVKASTKKRPAQDNEKAPKR